MLFAPEDLVLVKGDPDARRRYLDELTVLLVPRMAGTLADYDRVLRQRSALLKSAGAARRSASAPDLRTLDVWDAKLAHIGARIIVLRQSLVEALRPHASTAYEQVSSGQGHAEIGYKSSLEATESQQDGSQQDGSQRDPLETAATAGGTSLAESHERVEARMIDAMGRLRAKEIERGVCLVGPHRDDLVLTLGGLPAKGYASHGESWSFALALRLASYRLLTDGPDVPDGASQDDAFWFAESGPDTEPVLILDDVFAELDNRRRARLADLVAGAGQVLITAAVPEDIPEQLVGARLDVSDGRVTRAD